VKFGIRFFAVGAAIALVVFVSLRYVLDSWFEDDGRPLVGKIIDYSSPDMQWIATLEEVDNGLGFGQGMLYDEVHIRHPDERILEHGNDAKSAVFYADAMGKSSTRPRIKWIDSTHLLITYSPARLESTGPGRVLGKFHGIAIAYVTDSPK
jgi:hypothetical protein